MARFNSRERGNSGRPTRSGASAGRKPTGARRTARGTTRGQTAAGRRSPTTRRPTAGGGRPTTRSGAAAPPASHTSLIYGGLAVGVVLVVALIIALSSSGDSGEKKPQKETRRSSLADASPEPTPLPSTDLESRVPDPEPVKSKPIKPRKPMAYYRKYVDMKLWEEAQGLARQAEKMANELRQNKVPAGMTKKEAQRKAKDLYLLAVEKGAEFMSPLDNQREEAEHFIVIYEDVMMSWQRKARSLLFSSNR